MNGVIRPPLRHVTFNTVIGCRGNDSRFFRATAVGVAGHAACNSRRYLICRRLVGIMACGAGHIPLGRDKAFGHKEAISLAGDLKLVVVARPRWMIKGNLIVGKRLSRSEAKR